MVFDDIGDILGRDKEGQLSEDEDRLEMVASEVFPPLHDNKNGSVYRRRVLKRFLQLRGSPPKRSDEVEQYRSEAESRLDRALTQTADAYDRSEMTIRSLCIHDVYDGEDHTGQFLADLLRIEQRLLHAE